mmetsp:Transcript_24468/g.42086  ORF Transcript_24468/g.42086 Transcript_24468/m.42086 type:complete len:229 (-) Transcript_24468:919-1605(-)
MMADGREQDGKLENDAKDDASRNEGYSRGIACHEGKLSWIFVQIEPGDVEEERCRQEAEISFQGKFVRFVDCIKTNGANDSKGIQSSKRLEEAKHQLSRNNSGSPTSVRQCLRSLHELIQGGIPVAFFKPNIRFVLGRLLFRQTLVRTDGKKGEDNLENKIDDGSYKNEFDGVRSASCPLLAGKVHVDTVNAEPAQINKYRKPKKQKVSPHCRSIPFVKSVENEQQNH